MPTPQDPLHAHLDQLIRETDAAARIARDPLQFVRRYHRREDQEVAALLASGMAFGRVDLFSPVLAELFRHLDRHGGPAAFVRDLDDARAAPLRGLVYRWVRGPDVITVLRGVRRALAGAPLESLFAGPGDLRSRLARGLDRLRDAAAADGPLTRGALTFLPDAAAGSACKRWNLALRWLVRPADGVDLGVWTTFRPAELIIPLDTHVGRVSRFLGLTAREDASWRTAEQITAALRRFDPHDPVRFDFALAHLGISGACLGHRDVNVCPGCPLDRSCRAPATWNRRP
jgi:uncharacterized protein (TIGR02757 family)